MRGTITYILLLFSLTAFAQKSIIIDNTGCAGGNASITCDSLAVHTKCIQDIVNDGDSSAFNEIQQLTIQDNVISLSLNGGSVTIPAGVVASTLSPLPDNLDDSAGIRQGIIGTSDEYARADHKHPINALANPGYPVYTINGPGTLNATVNYGFESTEETVTFRNRLQVLCTQSNGWVFWNVPAIVGFGRPYIKTLTTYRYSGNPQDEMPRAPYMGSEAAEWTNIPRVYLGPRNRADGFANYYVHVVTEYTIN